MAKSAWGGGTGKAGYAAFTLLAPLKTTSFPEKVWVLIAVVQMHPGRQTQQKATIFCERNKRFAVNFGLFVPNPTAAVTIEETYVST